MYCLFLLNIQYKALREHPHLCPFICHSQLDFKGKFMAMEVFSCCRKNDICLVWQAKTWAAKQNLITCVSYSSTLLFSHGDAILLRESQWDLCGPFLIWTWKMERRRREEGGGAVKRRSRAPPGMIIPVNSLGGLWKGDVFTCLFKDWLSKLDIYSVYGCGSQSFHHACRFYF